MPDRRLHGAVSGPDVRLLQFSLNALGFDPGDMDGIYGPRTAAAVRQYQATRGLKEDGKVGPVTWEGLSGEKGSETPGHPLRRMLVGATSGADVREVQGALGAAGFDPGHVDGIYGPDTATAVRAFQLVHGLRQDGIVGAATWSALLTRRLRLSATVAGVLRESPDPTIPSEVAQRILSRHPEYGDGLGGSAYLKPDTGELWLSPLRWLAQVRALYDTDEAPELHGRLVVMGLALLSTDVAVQLGAGLDEVMRELREPLDGLLTPRGRYLRYREPDSTHSFGRLSPSSVSALSYAEGFRIAVGSEKVHMEHLLAGLHVKESGPTYRMLDRKGLGREGLADAIVESVGTQLPESVEPLFVDRMPTLSRHVAQAVDLAYRLADAAASPTVRTRHLLHSALSIEECGLVRALARRGASAADVQWWDDISEPAAVPAIRPPLLAGAAADTVPELGHVREADHLDTAAEVEMLVSVLLARDTPLPLAVGLFGDWGSGKSFFMAQMEERMTELEALAKAGRPEAAPYCQQIRQIRFNAWHYVDTDLWSSLAATLFDKLAAAGAPKEVDTKLKELEQARGKVDRARSKREELEREAQALEAHVSRSTWGVSDGYAVAIRAVRGRRDLSGVLGQMAHETGPGDLAAERLVTALGEMRTVAEKVRAAWRLLEEELLYRWRWTTLTILVVLLTAGGALSYFTPWPEVATVVGAVGAAAGPALGGALRLLYSAREVREARELPLVEKREELAQARVAEDHARSELAEREQELDGLRDKGRRLQDFVRERAASSDYRAKLGVMSLVRRDFEEIDALVRKADEANKPIGQVPQVERIVLYIDDLDRCPPEKVVDVLQAVHLLLAFKLFVVVVGVDSQWLERSLRNRFRLLQEPDNYLEKIFQIPFALRRMTPSHYQRLVNHLTPAPDMSRTRDSQQPEPRKTSPSPATPSGDGPAPAGGTSGVGAAEAPPPPAVPRPEALVLTEAERQLLGRMGALVPTPRAAKRLVNIYRMLRVSVPQEELDAFGPTGTGEYQAVVLLVAVLVGQPAHSAAVLASIVDAANEADIWDVLAECPEVADRLQPLRPHITLNHAAPYRRWAPRVSRFSFRLAAVLPTEDVDTQPTQNP
jgi:hypothetical protein